MHSSRKKDTHLSAVVHWYRSRHATFIAKIVRAEAARSPLSTAEDQATPIFEDRLKLMVHQIAESTRQISDGRPMQWLSMHQVARPLLVSQSICVVIPTPYPVYPLLMLITVDACAM